MLGDIPGNVRAYYKLENVNDSSPNGFNLTNNGSIAFSSGKYSNAAVFTGSIGEGLTYGSNIFSSTTPNDVFFSLWFKLTSTTATSSRTIFVATSKTSATDGRQYTLAYAISGTTLTFTFTRLVSSGTDAPTASITATTDWIYILCRRDNSAPSTAIAVGDKNLKQLASGSSSSSTTGASNTTNPTVFLSIGNGRGLAGTSPSALIENLIIDETTYPLNQATDGGVQRSNRFRLETNYKGYFV